MKDEKEIPYFVHPDDIELLATLLARLITTVQPEVDEVEAYDLMVEYLGKTGDLTIETTTLLGRLIRAETMFNPKRDVWQ